MRYMLLIYNSPEDWPDQTADEMNEAYFAYTEELASSGKLLVGDALQGTDTATSVRVRDGRTVTTDGPFAETKEVLGGYYLIDAEDLDDAIAWAAKIPGATYGTIEVRPIREFPSGM